jgi:hypothetical protein
MVDLPLDSPNWWSTALPNPTLVELKKITHHATVYTKIQFILLFFSSSSLSLHAITMPLFFLVLHFAP